MGKSDYEGDEFKQFIETKNLRGENIQKMQLPMHRLKMLGSFLDTLEFNDTRSFDK